MPIASAALSIALAEAADCAMDSRRLHIGCFGLHPLSVKRRGQQPAAREIGQPDTAPKKHGGWQAPASMPCDFVAYQGTFKNGSPRL
jgi:hypothetical protein